MPTIPRAKQFGATPEKAVDQYTLFDEALKAQGKPKAGRTREGLAFIQRFYAVEH